MHAATEKGIDTKQKPARCHAMPRRMTVRFFSPTSERTAWKACEVLDYCVANSSGETF